MRRAAKTGCPTVIIIVLQPVLPILAISSATIVCRASCKKRRLQLKVRVTGWSIAEFIPIIILIYICTIYYLFNALINVALVLFINWPIWKNNSSISMTTQSILIKSSPGSSLWPKAKVALAPPFSSNCKHFPTHTRMHRKNSSVWRSKSTTNACITKSKGA